MSAIKKLPHRIWSDVRDQWVNHIPLIEFAEYFPSPVAWDMRELNDITPQSNPVFEASYIDGLRESVFREAVILARKFTYCRANSYQALRHGAFTWSVIGSYDACFYAAKSLCYLLGIASVGRSSALYVDVLHSRTLGKGKDKREVYDVINIYKMKDRLTHEMLWEILDRLLRTLSLPENAAELERTLRNIDLDKVSRLRNQLLYDGGFWMNNNEYEHCDLRKRLGNLKLKEAFETPSPCTEESERYFYISHVLGEAISFFLSDIATLAPAVSAEVTAIEGWRLQAA